MVDLGVRNQGILMQLPNPIRSLVLILAFALVPLAPAYASLISVAGGDVYVIDPQTGSETFVGTTGFTGINSLTRDPTTGTLYSYAIQGLITIDPVTGAGSLIGGSGLSTTGLAFSPTGEMYAVRNPRSTDPGGVNGTDVLVRIDLVSGDQTDVGSLGGLIKSAQSLTFLGDTLYGWDIRMTGGLFTVDLATGRGTDLAGATNPFLDIQAMGASADGTFIWGIGTGFIGGLARIDPLTGDQITVGPYFANSHRGVEDLGPAVPEPQTVLLLGSGLAALARFRRPSLR